MPAAMSVQRELCTDELVGRARQSLQFHRETNETSEALAIKDNESDTNVDPPMTPRVQYDAKAQAKGKLTLDLIMSLGNDEIERIKDVFKQCERETMTMPEFIEVFYEQAQSTHQIDREQFVSSLIDLFESMDLDSNRNLEFDEFLATIIHLGMNVSSSRIAPIRPYYPGPPFLKTHRAAHRHVQYFAGLDRMLLYEANSNMISLYVPSTLKCCRKVKLDRKDILCFEHVFGGIQNYNLLAVSNTSGITIRSGLSSGEFRTTEQIVTRKPQTALKWSEANELLFSGSSSGDLSAFDLAKHRDTNLFRNGSHHRPHADVVTSFALLNTLDTLASGSLDSVVKLWDIDSGKISRSFDGHRKGVTSLAFSDAFKFLVSGGLDHEISVWSPYASHMMFKMSGHVAGIIDIQFVKDTPQVISIDSDGWLKM